MTTKSPQRRSITKSLLPVIAILIALAPASKASAGTEFAFPRPASLEPNVKFWVNVFTYYSDRDFILHDRDKVWKVYQVYSLPGSGTPGRDDVEWTNAYLKNKYTDILNKLASGREPMGSDERRVAAM